MGVKQKVKVLSSLPKNIVEEKKRIKFYAFNSQRCTKSVFVWVLAFGILTKSGHVFICHKYQVYFWFQSY